MAQRSNDKRLQRQKKSDRNMYFAVILLTAGLVAEWYLLMLERYYVRGTMAQMVGCLNYLGVMRWVGLGILAAGAVLLALREKKRWFGGLGVGLALGGAFFAFSSAVMRHAWPTSVTVMCVFVPVVMILGIVYLFYQAEFSVQATALAMALFALVLLSRSYTIRVRACAVVALVCTAALAIGTLVLKGKGGKLKIGGKELRVFAANTNYSLTLGVLALCFALVLLALLATGTAFYATWAMALVSFILAVYYTIKLM